MSKQIIKSQQLVDLSTKEQEFLSGGQINPLGANQIPTLSSVLGNEFPRGLFGSANNGNANERVNSQSSQNGVTLF